MSAYTLGATAENDLRAILNYITEHEGLARAILVHDAFIEAFDRLATAPAIGVRSRLTGANYRRWRVYNYFVFYDVQSRPLRIVRIVHGARDLPRLFGEH